MADYGRITIRNGKNYFYDDKTQQLGKEVKLNFGDTGLDRNGSRNMWDGHKWVPMAEVTAKKLNKKQNGSFTYYGSDNGGYWKDQLGMRLASDNVIKLGNGNYKRLNSDGTETYLMRNGLFTNEGNALSDHFKLNMLKGNVYDVRISDVNGLKFSKARSIRLDLGRSDLANQIHVGWRNDTDFDTDLQSITNFDPETVQKRLSAIQAAESYRPQSQDWLSKARANTAKRMLEVTESERLNKYVKEEMAKPEQGDGSASMLLQQPKSDLTRFDPTMLQTPETKLDRVYRRYVEENGIGKLQEAIKGDKTIETSKSLLKGADNLALAGTVGMIGAVLAPYIAPWTVKQIPWMTADYGINKGLDAVAENNQTLAPIANNKWVRTAASAIGMSSGNFVTNTARFGLNAAVKEAPKSFLRDQILFHSGTLGTTTLGDNFAGSLAGFTLGSLATRKYPGMNSLDKFKKDFKFWEKPDGSILPKLKYPHRFLYNVLTSAGSSVPLAVASELGKEGSNAISLYVDPETGEWAGKFLNAYLLHNAGKALNIVDRGVDAFKANNAILVGTTSKPGPTAKTVLYNLLNTEPSGSIRLDIIENRRTLLDNLKRNLKHSYHFAIDSPDLLLYLLSYVDNLNPIDRFMPGKKRGFLLGEGQQEMTNEGVKTTTLTLHPTALLVHNSPFYRIITNNVSAEPGEHYDTGEVTSIKTENLPSSFLSFIKENYPTIIRGDKSVPVFRVKGNISLDESNKNYINKKALSLPGFSEKEARRYVEERELRNLKGRMHDEEWNLFWNTPAEDSMIIGTTGPMTLGENIHNNGGRSIVNTAGYNIYCKKINGKWYAVGFDFTKFLADNYDAAHVSGASNVSIKKESQSNRGIGSKIGEKVKRIITPQLLNSIDNGVMIHTTEVTPLSKLDLKRLFDTRNNIRLASYQTKKYDELTNKARVYSKIYLLLHPKEQAKLGDKADELDFTKLTPKERLFIEKFESDRNAGAYKFSENQLKLLKILGNNERRRKDLLKLAEEARSYGLLSEDEYIVIKANSNARLTPEETERYRLIITSSKEEGNLNASDQRRYVRHTYRRDKNLDCLFTKSGDFKKYFKKGELEQLDIEKLKKSIGKHPLLMEDIKESSFRLYQLLLELKDGGTIKESKLDKLKLFKKGGIVLLPKKLTWEKYQKQNRKK